MLLSEYAILAVLTATTATVRVAPTLDTWKLAKAVQALHGRPVSTVVCIQSGRILAQLGNHLKEQP